MRVKREHPPLRDPQKLERLRYIDEELFWAGEVTRRSIEEAFGVSEETAKADLRDYRRGYAPDLEPDPRDNIYRVSLDFVTRVSRPDPDTYLGRLALRGTQAIPVATVPDADRRRVDPTIMQSVVRAIRNRQEIETYYRSPRAETARCYRIFPHALLHDGFRWSVRCYIRRETGGHWGELVLDRIEEVSAETWPAENLLAEQDEEWATIVEVELVPNPGLDTAGRGLIEEQYGMQDGRKVVAVRHCMLAYFLKRYQLEEPTTLKAPHQAPLDLRDRAIIMDLVPPGMRVPLEDSGAAAPRAMRCLQFILPDYTEQEILERALADLLRSIAPGD